jgi:very-short-patch-repair endonuclease
VEFERKSHAPGAVKRSRGLKRGMTWTEARLWKELRKLDANFRRQAPLGRYFADFATHAGKLVIEVDGEIHERLASVAVRDIERQAWIESQGYRVVRFSAREVEGDVLGCIKRIIAVLAAKP